MPDLCDAACQKLIINSRLIAYIARNLAEALGEGHTLYKRARMLATAARAACEAYNVALEEKRLERTGPSGWKGCDDAEFLMQVVTDAEAGKRIATVEVSKRINALIERANATTIRFVKTGDKE